MSANGKISVPNTTIDKGPAEQDIELACHASMNKLFSKLNYKISKRPLIY